MKKFYKDLKIIAYCKKCGVMFRPQRGSSNAAIGLCYPHRRQYGIEYHRKWIKSLSPEALARYRAADYVFWKKWVALHIDRRRAQALASYHKQKKLKGRCGPTGYKKKTPA